MSGERLSLPHLRAIISALDHSGPGRGPEDASTARSVIDELELVLINDATRSEWSRLVRETTGSPAGWPWAESRQRLPKVIRQGLVVLEPAELIRLALDLKTIRDWSGILLERLTPVWWEILLVHGRRYVSE